MWRTEIVINSILLFLISFVLTSCTSPTTTANQAKEVNSNSQNPISTDSSQEIERKNRFPIIEIWQELDGSVAIRGKSLYFRMYDDGVVEFEYILKKKDESGKSRSVFSLERTSATKISEEELNGFKSLLNDLTKSKNIKEEYKPVGLIFDVTVKLTILLNENVTTKREIIVNNSDLDVIDESLEKEFPKLLVNLIKEVHSIRVKLQENGKNL